MKYLISHSLDSKEKQQLYHLGLYCYDLRDSDSGNDIASIEKNVLVNRVGSIITDRMLEFEKRPNDFIDYEMFCINNTSVDSLDELLISKKYITKIKLDSDENIKSEFDFLFSEDNNYNKIKNLSISEKEKYILEHISDIGDYELMKINDYEYKLYRFDYFKKLEKIKNEKER